MPIDFTLVDASPAHLYCLSYDEWCCSACGDVKYLDTLEAHTFPNYCDECGMVFDPPEFATRAHYGYFYDPAGRQLVRLTQAPDKRTKAGGCPSCGCPVEPVKGGPSPHVRACPACGEWYRGVKVERE